MPCDKFVQRMGRNRKRLERIKAKRERNTHSYIKIATASFPFYSASSNLSGLLFPHLGHTIAPLYNPSYT